MIKTPKITFWQRILRIEKMAKEAANAEDEEKFEHLISILTGMSIALEYANIESIWRNDVICIINNLKTYWSVCNE